MTLALCVVKIYETANTTFLEADMLDYVELKPQSGQVKTIVLFLHGLGADCHDLIGLGEVWQNGLPDTLFISPNAPQPCDMAPYGYQWFSLQDRSPDAMLAGIKAADGVLNGFIDAVLAKYGVPEDKLAVVGFSQGCMMACYTMPRRKTACAGVVGYSGLLADPEGLLAQTGRVKMPVLLVHGDMDEVVPYSRLAEAEEGFGKAGYSVRIITSEGVGHGIDQTGLTEGLRFLQQVFEI